MFTCLLDHKTVCIVVTWVCWVTCSLWTCSLVKDDAKRKWEEKNRRGNGPLSTSSCSKILLGPCFQPEPFHGLGDTYLPKRIWYEQDNYNFDNREKCLTHPLWSLSMHVAQSAHSEIEEKNIRKRSCMPHCTLFPALFPGHYTSRHRKKSLDAI